MHPRDPIRLYGSVTTAAVLGIAAAVTALAPVGPLVAALAGLNLVAFLLYGLDKLSASAGDQKDSLFGRVPERVLLGIAIFGGAVGAWGAMQAFRHKTQKPAFRFGVPVLALAEGALLLLALFERPGLLTRRF